MTGHGLWRVLVVLCITEITSWGVLYYAFPVLAPSIAADTGWPVSTVTAAFSGGLIVSAVAGIGVGRVLDRHGPRWVMTAGSVLAVPAVVLVATARTLPVFVAGWLLAGLAQSATLYPPAFAALTRWWGTDRVRALTVLTMVAGLASTVFAPTAAALLGVTDWRGTYLVLAVVLAVVTIPLHLVGLRGAWPEPEPAPPADDGTADDRTAAQVARSRAFVLVVAMVSLGAFVSFAVPVNQVPLLIERGLSTDAAAWALGLSGIGQVLGRLGYARLASRTGPRGRAGIVLGLLAATTGLLGVLPGPAFLLVVVAMATGAARGVMTLLQATVLSDRWPTGFYGRLGGVLSAPVMIAIAVGPWAGSALAGLLGGYPPVFAVLAGIAVVAAVLSAGTAPRPVVPGGISAARTPRS
ncbi:MFS transporter [Pseudonocardia sediminis]|uniref:MFS transporter n=1 Tax=Pseudonocardia sediminis TaxID=1397368 RepID=UPI001F5F5213|nr:MFS transporter [Pseudonocardia sediminis]